MSFKTFLKYNRITKLPYAFLKRVKDDEDHKRNFKYKGKFINRSKGSKNLCIILAGYKSYLYADVFGRISKYKMDDLDICIVSSGLYSEELNSIAECNGWSYLSTQENNVSLVQNVAISLHPQAQYIFKLDEDIFITEHFYENMLRAYEYAESTDYNPGIIAPLIPINGYGHVRILKKLDLVSEYEDRFGKLKFAAGNDRPIENSPEVAKFFWGEKNIIPSIDEMNAQFSAGKIEISPVPIRFSIGAILFKRDLWEAMGGFKVNDRRSVELGNDEVNICTYCLIGSRPIIVSENVVVGHFSFGPQNKEMKEYYNSHIKSAV